MAGTSYGILGVSQGCLSKQSLGVCAPVSVGTMTSGKLLLQRVVTSGFFRMGAQVIPEKQATFPEITIVLDHVQAICAGVGWSFVEVKPLGEGYFIFRNTLVAEQHHAVFRIIIGRRGKMIL